MPTEAELTKQLGVSRSVLREAVSALRADGLLASRQGAGVFVLKRQEVPPLALLTDEAATIADVIEELELRAAVEIEAAGLAAERASPAQQAEIQLGHRAFGDAATAGTSTEGVDYAFHLAIASATNNRRFKAFLAHLGARTIPRVKIVAAVGPDRLPSRDEELHAEHRAIVTAILAADGEAARGAMREHLIGSMARYRKLIPPS